MFNLNVPGSPVSADRATGRPREIRTGRERMGISRVESVREESAAYPLDAGPRTVFVVWARGRRYRLTHLLSDDRWLVEEMGSSSGLLIRAA